MNQLDFSFDNKFKFLIFVSVFDRRFSGRGKAETIFSRNFRPKNDRNRRKSSNKNDRNSIKNNVDRIVVVGDVSSKNHISSNFRGKGFN